MPKLLSLEGVILCAILYCVHLFRNCLGLNKSGKSHDKIVLGCVILLPSTW